MSDVNEYQRFKQFAEYYNLTISNFIENAACRFIKEDEYLDDFKNDEILSNKQLMITTQRGWMAASDEDWSAWDATIDDGLGEDEFKR